MSDTMVSVSPMGSVPTEILFSVFKFVPTKQLMKCRLVCIRWKKVIDKLACRDQFWQERCEKEFSNYYYIAKGKAKKELSCFDLYRSMSLWSKLAFATEESDEFAAASRLAEEIRSVEVLGYNVVGVHRKCAIQYFNAETLKMTSLGSISGDFARYTENEHLIVIQTYHLHLFIMRKFPPQRSEEQNTTFEDVKMYILTKNELYYVKLNDEIYVCNVYSPSKVTAKFIKRAEDLDGVMSLGYTDGSLNVLTYQRNIYRVVDDKDLVLVKSLMNERNILHVLHKYNFLEQLDWRVYFQWMYILHHSLPEGPLRDIIVIRSYGDLFFVGSNCGVLTIFYRPYINGEVNLFRTRPVRQVNFMQRSDIPVLATCPILQIDVMETEKGHTVYVAMPKKVAVLKYSHNFYKPEFKSEPIDGEVEIMENPQGIPT